MGHNAITQAQHLGAGTGERENTNSVDEARALLADYGQWAKDDTASDAQRYEAFVEVVAVLLSQVVADGAVQRVDLEGLPGLSFEYEGRDYLLSLAIGPKDAMGRAVLSARRSGRESERWALLWWTDTVTPDDEDLDRVEDAVRAFGVVLDRTHLDAAVAGLRPLPELIRGTFRQHQPHVPLPQLLTASRPPDQAWPMTPAARISPAVQVEMQAQAPLAAELLFMGVRALEDPPSGLTAISWPRGSSLLITGAHGVLEVGTRGPGAARWRLELSGCHGAPLLQSDDALLVMCGPALVRWHDGVLTVLAGAFEEGAQLLAGPGGEPWVLSGSGVTFGAGDGTLALTRVGSELGDQLRYPISFEAAVRSAVWLDGRRFFLAAGGHSAVVDLGRSTDAGRREHWIPTAGHYPAHLLADGRGGVLSASTDGSGNHVLLHRTHVADRSSETVADLRLAQVFGLAQTDGADGPIYVLASLPESDPSRVRPVVVRLSAHQPAAESGTGDTGPAGARMQEYGLVSGSARGEKKDYRLERLPLAEGGQAEVFRAMHKASRVDVAFKRRLGKGARERRRMRREIELAQRLGGHPHVMPVLDFSPDHAWFVMPVAQATAEDLRSELLEPGQLRVLVDAVASALAAAHEHGWLHRDIKPSNVLYLEGWWVLADWGIVRRPRGQTSDLGILTKSAIGTEGFAAPELSADAHEATFASDIYSLGQLIGWILTGTWPQPNVPLLPPPGPWYGVVRRATHLNPALRPQDIPAFLNLVEQETVLAAGLPIIRARRLLEAANAGDYEAAGQLLGLAADRPGDYELYLEAVAALGIESAGPVLLSDVPRAVAVFRALASHARGDGQGNWAQWGEMDRAISWLLAGATLAAREEQWELLDVAADGMCEWDGSCDQWNAQNSIKGWLRSLDGQAAAVVASVLRQHPYSARHFHELVDERSVDLSLRGAIHDALAERG
ncbi:protein kinase [Streptomyces sp. NPDC059835]|uniref:protein kinase domain-containing protein n=1 Tax=Streptomyces sp. NPDC059835 TaxID=3346967 RepID=UPI003658661F